MSGNPANVLNIEGGELKEGAAADITIADLGAKWTVDKNDFVSKGKNTPFNGFEVYGKVVCTIVDGAIKYGK